MFYPEAVVRSPAVASIVCGVACHILFNRLEPRRPSVILTLIFGPPIGIAFWLHATYRNSAVAILVSSVIHIVTLVCSVVAYRLSPFHPLAGFPGPIMCKITRLWATYIVQTGNQHRYSKSLHARYGTHVRTGPNHIHICDASALPTVMGIKNFRRGDRYEVAKLHGTTGSLISINDPQEHAQRRKLWDRSMNTTAVQGYKDLLSERVAQLVGALEQRQELAVDIASWLSCFSFDFMGDLAFGSTFRLMEQGSDVDGYMNLARLGAKLQETLGTIPWVKPFQHLIPIADLRRFREFSKNSVLARKTKGSTRKDIFYYLLDEEGVGSKPLSLPTLILESGLAIVAGSDTTGTALSNVFFYLLSNPPMLARLQAEVDNTFPQGTDVFTSSNAVEMKFLNAVINETLRLQPAVPNGVQRVLPRGNGGVMAAGRYIPEGTTVQVAAYSVHRNPRYFSPDPETFRPDRWLETNSGSELDQSAFFPFSYGPTSCAGKNLALLELRMVICSLLQKFDFELAPGSTKHMDWEKNLEDCFILTKGELPVRVKMRK